MNGNRNEENEQEIWRAINLRGFQWSYMISNLGRVKSNAYSIYKDREVKQVEARILNKPHTEGIVYLNGEFRGEYKIKALLRHTFPNTKININ